MTQSNEMTLDQMPFSAEEWAQTPEVVVEFVRSLLARVQALEVEIAALRDQVSRNSRNSSGSLEVGKSPRSG